MQPVNRFEHQLAQMKKLLLTVLILAVASSAVAVRAQEFRSVKLSDAVMRRVVSHIVRSEFVSRAEKQTFYFSDRLIKAEWLPKMANITFIVLDNSEKENSEKEKFVFYDVTSDGKHLEVRFGRGTGCSLSGQIWRIRIVRNKLSIAKQSGGWGTGFGSGQGEGHGVSNCGSMPQTSVPVGEL